MLNRIKASLIRLRGRLLDLRTVRDALFIVFGFFLTILLPAISEMVNPANWANPVAIGFYKNPIFWAGFVGIIVLLIVAFRVLRSLDNKIYATEDESRKQLQRSIKTLNEKLNKLDKLDKLDKLVATLEKLTDRR